MSCSSLLGNKEAETQENAKLTTLDSCYRRDGLGTTAGMPLGLGRTTECCIYPWLIESAFSFNNNWGF
jgi:hypothetical protein